MENTDRQRIITNITSSKKYQGIPHKTINNLLSIVISKHPHQKPGHLEKITKRKLHQVHGAFLDQSIHKTLGRIDRLIDLRDGAGVSFEVNKLISQHSSTAERTSFATEFYNQILTELGKTESISDYGCGVNPLLACKYISEDVQYSFFDIDEHSTGVMKRYFDFIDKKAFNGYVHNLLIDTPEETDTIFFFKLFQVLEHQKKGIGIDLLNSIKARKAVVSFPLKTLSRRSVGMESTYQDYMHQILGKNSAFKIKSILRFENELVYVLTR
jgi:16S rRNA (guanine(1405)-N(7))-methyltransferase